MLCVPAHSRGPRPWGTTPCSGSRGSRTSTRPRSRSRPKAAHRRPRRRRRRLPRSTSSRVLGSVTKASPGLRLSTSSGRTHFPSSLVTRKRGREKDEAALALDSNAPATGAPPLPDGIARVIMLQRLVGNNAVAELIEGQRAGEAGAGEAAGEAPAGSQATDGAAPGSAAESAAAGAGAVADTPGSAETAAEAAAAGAAG